MACENGDPDVSTRFVSNAWNRTGKRKPNPKQRFPAEVLTPEEVQRLLDACPNTHAGIRNRSMLAVLYRAGLRINEALSLHLKDFDPIAGSIRVLNGKGGKARTVGMDAEGFTILKAWLDIREQRRISDRSPIFCLIDGRPLRSSYVRVLLPRLARHAKIAKRVHAHGLRHTHAAELRAEGIDIGIISKQLGHWSIATTARYLDHIAPFAVLDAMKRRSWQPGDTAHVDELNA